MTRQRPRKIIKNIENITQRKRLLRYQIILVWEKVFRTSQHHICNFMDCFVLPAFWVRAILLMGPRGSPQGNPAYTVPFSLRGLWGWANVILHHKMVGNTSLPIRKTDFMEITFYTWKRHLVLDFFSAGFFSATLPEKPSSASTKLISTLSLEMSAVPPRSSRPSPCYWPKSFSESEGCQITNED